MEKEKIMISLWLQLARVDEPLGHFHCLLPLVFQILVPKPSNRTKQVQFDILQ